jgi:hypothetical protein
MNDISGIISKIKKLFALSKSPNPNEAASALKMARGLMAEYKIGQADASNIDIGEEVAPTIRRKKLPRYETRLIADIASAFGCEVIYHPMRAKCVWRFIGLRHRAQVAAYIGQVLMRKIRNARTEYTKTLYRVRSKYRKTQRADDFCNAWVWAVTDKLSSFASMSDEEQRAVTLYVEKNHPNLENISSIKRSLGKEIDYLNGAEAGGGVHLQHGVGVHSTGSLLLEA